VIRATAAAGWVSVKSSVAVGKANATVELGESAELFLDAGHAGHAGHADQDQRDVVAVVAVAEEVPSGGVPPGPFLGRSTRVGVSPVVVF